MPGSQAIALTPCPYHPVWESKSPGNGLVWHGCQRLPAAGHGVFSIFSTGAPFNASELFVARPRFAFALGPLYKGARSVGWGRVVFQERPSHLALVGIGLSQILESANAPYNCRVADAARLHI